LTFGLGIIILQGISRRKSLAGVNIMYGILDTAGVPLLFLSLDISVDGLALGQFAIL
jgi:hypothetical protein